MENIFRKHAKRNHAMYKRAEPSGLPWSRCTTKLREANRPHRLPAHAACGTGAGPVFCPMSLRAISLMIETTLLLPHSYTGAENHSQPLNLVASFQPLQH